MPIYGGWYRRNVEESVFFHQLMARMYRAFFSSNRWKLTGTVSLDQVLLSPENTVWEYRTGKVFHIGSNRGDLRDASADVELIEILNGTPATGDEDPLPIEPPVVFREHSLEFSLEFS